jgi:hypothetical protein
MKEDPEIELRFGCLGSRVLEGLGFVLQRIRRCWLTAGFLPRFLRLP